MTLTDIASWLGVFVLGVIVLLAISFITGRWLRRIRLADEFRQRVMHCRAMGHQWRDGIDPDFIQCRRCGLLRSRCDCQ